MAHKIGALITAAKFKPEEHFVSVECHAENDKYIRIKLRNMWTPGFTAQDRDEVTVALFHGTSLSGAIGILQNKRLLTKPEHANEHVHAIYGKGFQMCGHAPSDKEHVIRILNQMQSFTKNQCGVIFQLRTSGHTKKIEMGGTEAEEEYLAKHKRGITHVRQGKVSRWACHPDNATIVAMWIIEDIFDFHEYDPLA